MTARTPRLFPLVALAALVGCGSDDPPATGESLAAGALLDPAVATIVYRNDDGSIPPPDYRRRELTVTPESSRLVVSDRDGTLEESTLVTDPAAVEETLRRLAESDLPAVVGEEACPGAPLHELEVGDATGAVVRRVEILCPSGRRSAPGELRGIVEPLLVRFERTASTARIHR